MRLGDVVVSKPQDGYGGVVQYDLGKRTAGGKFVRAGVLNKPPTVLRNALAGLQREYEFEGFKLDDSLLDALQKHPWMREKFNRPDERDNLFLARIETARNATKQKSSPGQSESDLRYTMTLLRLETPS